MYALANWASGSRTDVTNPEDLTVVFQRINDELGRIDNW